MVEPHHALTPSQELHATLLLTHCLVGERIEGLKVRKLVARHKTSLRRKVRVTHAKLSPPPIPQALPPLLQWALSSLFCLVPPLTEDDNHPKCFAGLWLPSHSCVLCWGWGLSTGCWLLRSQAGCLSRRAWWWQEVSVVGNAQR